MTRTRRGIWNDDALGVIARRPARRFAFRYIHLLPQSIQIVRTPDVSCVERIALRREPRLRRIVEPRRILDERVWQSKQSKHVLRISHARIVSSVGVDALIARSIQGDGAVQGINAIDRFLCHKILS